MIFCCGQPQFLLANAVGSLKKGLLSCNFFISFRFFPVPSLTLQWNTLKYNFKKGRLEFSTYIYIWIIHPQCPNFQSLLFRIFPHYFCFFLTFNAYFAYIIFKSLTPIGSNRFCFQGWFRIRFCIATSDNWSYVVIKKVNMKWFESCVEY